MQMELCKGNLCDAILIDMLPTYVDIFLENNKSIL